MTCWSEAFVELISPRPNMSLTCSLSDVLRVMETDAKAGAEEVVCRRWDCVLR